MHSRNEKEKEVEEEGKCVCFMLYVILILSIDVMNVENILVDIIPRARFFFPMLNSLSFGGSFFSSLFPFFFFFSFSTFFLWTCYCYYRAVFSSSRAASSFVVSKVNFSCFPLLFEARKTLISPLFFVTSEVVAKEKPFFVI